MIALLALGVVAATWRVTRLLVVDEFPPVRALRELVIGALAEVDVSGEITGGRAIHWRQRFTVAWSMDILAIAGALLAEMSLWRALAVGGCVATATFLALRARSITRSIAYVWTCQWCMGVWVAGGVVALADWRLSVPVPWLLAALAASVTGAMSWVEAEHDQRWRLRQLQIEREEGRR